MPLIEGTLAAGGLRVAVVVSRFNKLLSSQLLEGALDAFEKHGGDRDKVDTVSVPGAFELPLLAARLAEREVYEALVCLGVVIRGGTPHFEYVCSEAAKGIATVSLSRRLPVSFGVITADTLEQAVERSGVKSRNKGWEAMVAAIETANVFKAVEELDG